MTTLPVLLVRCEASLVGYGFYGDVVEVGRTPDVEVLIGGGKLTVLADPESEALDQGDDGEEPGVEPGEEPGEDLEDDGPADDVEDVVAVGPAPVAAPLA